METKTSINHDTPPAAKPLLAAGWISVSEKLPEVTKDYLVTDGTAYMVAAFRLEKQEWDFWSIEWWSNDQVTHWMPLPSIPACS